MPPCLLKPSWSSVSRDQQAFALEQARPRPVLNGLAYPALMTKSAGRAAMSLSRVRRSSASGFARWPAPSPGPVAATLGRRRCREPPRRSGAEQVVQLFAADAGGEVAGRLSIRRGRRCRAWSAQQVGNLERVAVAVEQLRRAMRRWSGCRALICAITEVAYEQGTRPECPRPESRRCDGQAPRGIRGCLADQRRWLAVGLQCRGCRRVDRTSTKPLPERRPRRRAWTDLAWRRSRRSW